jgi:flagellar hook-length control protein FliK
VEQVAERVGLAHREGREEVSFRLDPPELGAVRIQAVLEGQRLTLHIRTEHEAARAALEQSMPQLKESLSQQGIVAGRVTIELGLDTSPRGFAGQGFAGSPREEAGDAPARSNAVSVQSRPWSETTDRRGVDVWV